MEVFPSEKFWLDLGLRPSRALGRARGPRQSAALSGWSHDDMKIATELTGEIPTLPKAKATLLTGLVATRAPQAVRFLALIRRFSETVRRHAIKSVALENGFVEPLPRSRRLLLLLYRHEPDLLKRVQYRSLASSGSVSYPFSTSEEMSRRRLTARGFRERLSSALGKTLDPQGVRRAEVDYVDAKKGNEAVTFAVRYERKPKHVEQWKGSHTDVPVKHALIRVLPKYKMVEVVSRQGRATTELASALSSAIWGAGDRFHALSEVEVAAEAGRMQVPSSDVKLETITLRSVEADNVSFDGSPSITLEAADLSPTVRQFREFDVDLGGKVVSWRVWIRFSAGDLTSETVVRRSRSSNRIQFNPEPPLEVKVEVYRRLKDGLTELELR